MVVLISGGGNVGDGVMVGAGVTVAVGGAVGGIDIDGAAQPAISSSPSNEIEDRIELFPPFRLARPCAPMDYPLSDDRQQIQAGTRAELTF
jgi:hypothetical protein